MTFDLILQLQIMLTSVSATVEQLSFLSVYTASAQKDWLDSLF